MISDAQKVLRLRHSELYTKATQQGSHGMHYKGPEPNACSVLVVHIPNHEPRTLTVHESKYCLRHFISGFLIFNRILQMPVWVIL